MTEVVLITSPMSFLEKKAKLGDETSIPWMGVLYLASYLEKHGFGVKIYDPGPEKLALSQIIKKLKKDRPKIVGVSSLTSGIRSAVLLAKAIKSEFKKEIIVGIGGSHINVDPDFIKRYPVFDFSIAGEGEMTFLKIVKKIIRGEKLTKKIFKGETIENLDEIPFPARHLIDLKNYYPTEYSKAKSKLSFGITGSRGCPFNCNFCSRDKSWRKVRFRSGKNIVSEMKNVAEVYGNHFTFTDDALTLNIKVIEEMCDEINRRGYKFVWNAMTRADCLNEKLIIKMRKAGCEELFFGVESGNDRVRNKVIKKNLSDQTIKRAIRLCQKHSIRVSVFLMLGFPTETKEELEDTVNFGLRFQPDFIGVHLTIPFPGSELFEIGIKEGQYPKNLVDLYATGKLGEFMEKWPVYIPSGMTKDYLINAKKRAYRKFYLSFLWILRRVKLWLINKEEFKHDLGLVKIGVYTLFYGRSKSAAS